MKKNSLQSVLRFALLSLSAIIFLIGLSACSGSQGQTIDGSWASPSGANQLLQRAYELSGAEGDFNYSEHSVEEIIPAAEVNLKIKENKASFDLVIKVDREAYFKAMNDEIDAAIESQLKDQGTSYEELDATKKAEIDAQRYSDKELYQGIDNVFKQIADALGGTYDAKTGQVTAKVFNADVDTKAMTITVTKANVATEDAMASEGEFYKYSLDDNELTLEGETIQDILVFVEKK